MTGTEALADLAAEVVASVSHDLTRALAPCRRLSDDERRQCLRSLATIILDESGWDVPPVVTPAHRPMVRYWSTVADPIPAFGRLLVAVRDLALSTDVGARDRASDEIVAALSRLVPTQDAAA